MTEWKLKLTGQLFTPTVCSVSLATQLQAAAIHLCQLIKNYNLFVCKGGIKKTNPPLIEHNTCRPLRVLSSQSSRRPLVLFVVRGLVIILS